MPTYNKIINITKVPDYKIIRTKIVDSKGEPVLDKYGHEQFSTDYSEFPDIERKCPCCGAEYSFKLPELIASGDFSVIGVNGLGIGFNCPYCQMPIVVCANSEYQYESFPQSDVTE